MTPKRQIKKNQATNNIDLNFTDDSQKNQINLEFSKFAEDATYHHLMSKFDLENQAANIDCLNDSHSNQINLEFSDFFKNATYRSSIGENDQEKQDEEENYSYAIIEEKFIELKKERKYYGKKIIPDLKSIDDPQSRQNSGCCDISKNNLGNRDLKGNASHQIFEENIQQDQEKFQETEPIAKKIAKLDEGANKGLELIDNSQSSQFNPVCCEERENNLRNEPEKENASHQIFEKKIIQQVQEKLKETEPFEKKIIKLDEGANQGLELIDNSQSSQFNPVCCEERENNLRNEPEKENASHQIFDEKILQQDQKKLKETKSFEKKIVKLDEGANKGLELIDNPQSSQFNPLCCEERENNWRNEPKKENASHQVFEKKIIQQDQEKLKETEPFEKKIVKLDEGVNKGLELIDNPQSSQFNALCCEERENNLRNEPEQENASHQIFEEKIIQQDQEKLKETEPFEKKIVKRDEGANKGLELSNNSQSSQFIPVCCEERENNLRNEPEKENASHQIFQAKIIQQDQEKLKETEPFEKKIVKLDEGANKGLELIDNPQSSQFNPLCCEERENLRNEPEKENASHQIFEEKIIQQDQEKLKETDPIAKKIVKLDEGANSQFNPVCFKEREKNWRNEDEEENASHQIFKEKIVQQDQEKLKETEPIEKKIVKLDEGTHQGLELIDDCQSSQIHPLWYAVSENNLKNKDEKENISLQVCEGKVIEQDKQLEETEPSQNKDKLEIESFNGERNVDQDTQTNDLSINDIKTQLINNVNQINNQRSEDKLIKNAKQSKEVLTVDKIIDKNTSQINSYEKNEQKNLEGKNINCQIKPAIAAISDNLGEVLSQTLLPKTMAEESRIYKYKKEDLNYFNSQNLNLNLCMDSLSQSNTQPEIVMENIQQWESNTSKIHGKNIQLKKKVHEKPYKVLQYQRILPKDTLLTDQKSKDFNRPQTLLEHENPFDLGYKEKPIEHDQGKLENQVKMAPQLIDDPQPNVSYLICEESSNEEKDVDQETVSKGLIIETNPQLINKVYQISNLKKLTKPAEQSKVVLTVNKIIYDNSTDSRTNEEIMTHISAKQKGLDEKSTQCKVKPTIGKPSIDNLSESCLEREIGMENFQQSNMQLKRKIHVETINILNTKYKILPKCVIPANQNIKKFARSESILKHKQNKPSDKEKNIDNEAQSKDHLVVIQLTNKLDQTSNQMFEHRLTNTAKESKVVLNVGQKIYENTSESKSNEDIAFIRDISANHKDLDEKNLLHQIKPAIATISENFEEVSAQYLLAKSLAEKNRFKEEKNKDLDILIPQTSDVENKMGMEKVQQTESNSDTLIASPLTTLEEKKPIIIETQSSRKLPENFALSNIANICMKMPCKSPDPFHNCKKCSFYCKYCSFFTRFKKALDKHVKSHNQKESSDTAENSKQEYLRKPVNQEQQPATETFDSIVNLNEKDKEGDLIGNSAIYDSINKNSREEYLRKPVNQEQQPATKTFDSIVNLNEKDKEGDLIGNSAIYDSINKNSKQEYLRKPVNQEQQPATKTFDSIVNLNEKDKEGDLIGNSAIYDSINKTCVEQVCDSNKVENVGESNNSFIKLGNIVKSNDRVMIQSQHIFIPEILAKQELPNEIPHNIIHNLNSPKQGLPSDLTPNLDTPKKTKRKRKQSFSNNKIIHNLDSPKQVLPSDLTCNLDTPKKNNRKRKQNFNKNQIINNLDTQKNNKRKRKQNNKTTRHVSKKKIDKIKLHAEDDYGEQLIFARKCKFCGLKMDSFEVFVNHMSEGCKTMNEGHPDLKVLVCGVRNCEFLTQDKEEFEQHKKLTNHGATDVNVLDGNDNDLNEGYSVPIKKIKENVSSIINCLNSLCDFMGTSVEEVKKHLETCEFGLPCQQCNYRSFNKDDLRRHESKHLHIKLTCNFCLLQFMDKESMASHYEKDHDAAFTTIMYNCKYCWFNSIKLSDAKNHFNHWHKKLGDFYECPICGSFTKVLTLYQIHFLQHINLKV